MNNNEYFLVPHRLSINLLPIDEQVLPSNQLAFEEEIPGPFRMASDLAKADASVLASLKLNSESTQSLWSYLEAQNQKINILLSYVLTQQDEQQSRYQTIKFSAGSLIIKSSNDWSIGQNARLKIFIPEESAAVYCYAKVSEMNESECVFTYTLIREQDRELLIRASLHVQSQQLKLRAQQRQIQT